MPMRYRRLSARFLRPPVGPRGVRPEPAWDVAIVALSPPVWRPAIDVCETADGLVVVLDIAGVDEEAVEVTLFADALVVEGERWLAPCAPEARYDRAEIRQGPFRVEMGLPFPVDADRVEAGYERGLLRITLPRGRPVNVEVAPSGSETGTSTPAPARRGPRRGTRS